MKRGTKALALRGDELETIGMGMGKPYLSAQPLKPILLAHVLQPEELDEIDNSPGRITN